MVDGRRASLEDACDRTIRLLKNASQPLIAGLGTDIDGMRGAVDLAESTGAIVDHMHGDALAATHRVMQTRGWFATTLSEIRARSDLVILIDVDLTDRYESFPRRCLTPKLSLAGANGAKRRVAHIGRAERCPRAADTDLRVNCTGQDVNTVIRELLAGLNSNKRNSARLRRSLIPLVSAIKDAKYTSIVFSAGMLSAQPETCIASMCDVVDEINKISRAAILGLGGDDGGQSAAAACTWLTGYPMRVGFSDGIQYGSQQYATQTLIERGAIDALLWLDAFGRHSSPPRFAPEKTVVLAAAEPENVTDFAAFIPLGTPGIDHFSRLTRTDNVSTLALRALRKNKLPSAADVFKQLLEAGR